MIRELSAGDLSRIDRFLDDMPMKSDARAAFRETLSPEGTRLLLEDERLIGLVCFGRVPFAYAGFEITWLLVRQIGDVVAHVTNLVDAVRVTVAADGPAFLRFVGGAVHRGGLDPSVLEAAGLERRGRVPTFYGPDDDLLVYASSFAPIAALPVEPTTGAALYDAAFGYRDFAAEREFLLACARAHGHRPVARVASWACGAGRHLHAFADVGIEGVGIEDDAELLELGQRLGDAHRGRSGFHFIASPLDAPLDGPIVDLSFTMLSAVHRLSSEAGMIAHLEAAASILAASGVHVIEATHPSDLDESKVVAWTELRDRFAIHSRFVLDPKLRAKDGTVPASLDVRCTDVTRGVLVSTLHQQERWLVPDLAAWRRIVEKSGLFEIAAILGDFQLDVSAEQAGAWRTILVLRRSA